MKRKGPKLLPVLADHVADRGAILLMPPAVAYLFVATPFGGLKLF
jgi:hypothetical protein